MKISVVLCTYSMDRYPEFQEAAESILKQTYDDIELVVVVDGTEEVYERVQTDYGTNPNTTIHCNDQNRGLSYSRNTGAELADGEVVAFLDDDAVAASDWAEQIIDAYERYDALAVGGRMVPDWLSTKPEYLPEEYYFLIGVTYKGFRETEGYVRNTFSSNLSFDREVFLDLGGFRTEMGKRGENDLQGGETELCARLKRETGERVVYVPDATIEHKIYEYRTDRQWLLERAFWQGYSKRRMAEIDSDAISTERQFLQQLLTDFIPSRFTELVTSPSVTKLDTFVMLLMFTLSIGVGYLYALVPDTS
ncbi:MULTISPECIES: glucosyl-dolichyl phosphate glucuronosyltransferase [unclassified Halorubrum]|uniref:glucosyl-dolichyl phosphate glucuronosyltransferase n=1 Tax=unclassified Halorubrum TaxID=2642239 RepID=UPI0010F644AD|nr:MULTISPECIES: glucosyl-dolichyl phosphate glucuronosyltransferase [unclassified Halorubrum]TKX46002.1 glycosyltransferase [Halorubrum sp. ARQ200]TKX50175.1 glycosyltransferase [Halorubrum sp. ASP121]